MIWISFFPCLFPPIVDGGCQEQLYGLELENHIHRRKERTRWKILYLRYIQKVNWVARLTGYEELPIFLQFQQYQNRLISLSEDVTGKCIKLFVSGHIKSIFSQRYFSFSTNTYFLQVSPSKFIRNLQKNNKPLANLKDE